MKAIKYVILHYNPITNAQVAAMVSGRTILKSVFFGIMAVVNAITIVSFEVLPLTAIPIVTIAKAQGASAGDIYRIDNIVYGKSEDEHIIGVVAVVTTARSYNMEIFPLPKNKKLVHQGFRIKEDVLRILDIQADKKGISLSNLVNKILENYVRCDMYFEELGFIVVSKDFLRKRFGRIEEEKYLIDDSRELGLTAAKEYIPYFYSQVNGDTLVQFLDIWFCKFQCYQHRIDNDRRCHYFIVNHDINMNFSIALKAFLQGLVESVIKGPVKFHTLTSNSITFSFEI